MALLAAAFNLAVGAVKRDEDEAKAEQARRRRKKNRRAIATLMASGSKRL